MKRALLTSIFAAIAICLAVPAAGHAQRTADESGDTKTKRKPMKKFDFSGDNVVGDVVNPTGDHVNLRTWASHESLIRIRSSFSKEILKSSEDI